MLSVFLHYYIWLPIADYRIYWPSFCLAATWDTSTCILYIKQKLLWVTTQVVNGKLQWKAGGHSKQVWLNVRNFKPNTVVSFLFSSPHLQNTQIVDLLLHWLVHCLHCHSKHSKYMSHKPCFGCTNWLNVRDINPNMVATIFSAFFFSDWCPMHWFLHTKSMLQVFPWFQMWVLGVREPVQKGYQYMRKPNKMVVAIFGWLCSKMP